MANENDFYDYPKGRFALGAGDLHDVFDVNIAYEDGEKVEATLRRNPAGSTHGTRSVTITFKSKLSHLGYERNYRENYRLRRVLEGRFKAPGGAVHPIVGRLSKPQITANLDNAVEFSVTMVGKDPTIHG